MNDEQIKEVMRRYGICAGSSSEWSVHEVGAGRKSLEAYLRTIGEPESVNTELLEALKSAKNGLEWYQDAHPESASECDDEAMQEIDAAIARAESAIETPANVSPCADQQIIDYVKGVYAFLESTSPAGFADEAFRLPPFATRAQQLFADAIQGDELGKCMGSEGQDSQDRERHEGAVAKVSPCAGHAVQQDADEAGGA